MSQFTIQYMYHKFKVVSHDVVRKGKVDNLTVKSFRSLQGCTVSPDTSSVSFATTKILVQKLDIFFKHPTRAMHTVEQRRRSSVVFSDSRVYL